MSKRRLLLADDSLTIQKVVNLTFAEEGIEVITAGDGNTAMEKFVQSPPDLVMVDVNMPGFDGYKICEMIKQDEETKQIPVILLVGSFEPFDEDEARRVGADDYLTKPFQSIRQLVSKVSDLLNRPNDNYAAIRQDNFSAPTEPEEAKISDFGDAVQMKSEPSYDTFDENGIDDEMIQTNQIGSLPVDESQKFVSEPNFQTSDNIFANPAIEEEEFAPKSESFDNTYFQPKPVNSSDDELLRFDEKVFNFADEQPASKEPEANASEFQTKVMADVKKFPEYSTMTEENQQQSGDVDFAAVPQNAPIFDFDDLNLLDLPPIEKKSAPAAEEETVIDEFPATAAETVEESEEPEELIEKYDTKETMQLSPEIIEAIAQRVMEKLSDKVVREIVQGVTPQTVESLVKEMAQKKTN